jgi:hypothetical protein
MRIRRRSLRKLLIAVGCAVGTLDLLAVAVGGFLMLVGSALHFWSKGCLEQNRRLTTAGPYRWTRNPFYLANLLIDVGLVFVIGRWWVPVLFLPIWWFSYRETIEREEARLLALFPAEFPDYVNSVPAMIPTGRRLPRDRAEGHFSWQNDALARGSEYARLLGIGLAPGTIWAGELLRRERMSVFGEQNSLALGLLALLLTAWIVKLALAETFRRPETALLPFLSPLILRHGVTVVLVATAIYSRSLWAVSLPSMWCWLLVLDRLGESRVDRADIGNGRAWRYFPAIASGSIVTSACVAALVRLSEG